MIDIELAPDEFVVSELHEATGGKGYFKKIYHVFLTNKRLLFGRLALLGKIKIEFEKSLSDVKIYNGAAQVKVSTVGGVQTNIDIYFVSEQMQFTLKGAANKDALRFANELNHVVTDTDVDLYSLSGNDTGKKAFMKALFGASSVELKKQVNEKVGIRCSNCGASFEGIKGKTAKCPYCNTVYNL